MMFDLQVLAYQTDLTRVITFMVGREFGGRTYQEIGIPEGYHALTHHQYNAEKMAKVIQIQTYHAKHFAYYLEKLRSTPDGDGSLLDHMVVLYGGGISDGNSHSARQSARRAGGRRVGPDEGRPSHSLCQGNTDDEPAALDARCGGRASGQARRFHGAAKPRLTQFSIGERPERAALYLSAGRPRTPRLMRYASESSAGGLK